MKNSLVPFPMLSSHLRIFSLLALCICLFVSCGGDDDVTANTSTVTFDELNMCDIGSGLMATRFNFRIDYETAEGIEVSKIEFELEWTSGDSDEAETSSFVDMGTHVEYSWCYRFGSEDWVEITHTLVASDGSKSNTSVVRINKPEGAN